MTNGNQKIIDCIYSEFNRQNIQVKKLIFFGSRARNENNLDSDWDFLIVINKKLSWTEKQEIRFQVSRKAVEWQAAIDLIIQTENEFQNSVTDKGRITYYALKEGILL